MAIAERELDRPAERMFSHELEQELLRYAGKWVAVTHDTLLAVGDSPSEVMAEAQAKGVQVPLIHHVPTSGAYFY
jgi:hypothetical protein